MSAAPEVRTATRADLPRIGLALARAFDDDPMTCHLLPPGLRSRWRRVTTFMRLPVQSAIPLGTVYTTPELVAAAVWRPPDRWKLTAGEQLRMAPGSMAALRGRARLGLSVLHALEKHHPTEPHWYLQVLGTEPASQAKGIGGALMAPVLERCDADGTPAYLESSKEWNVPYYERFGFEVTEEMVIPHGGPTLWAMWRDPR